MKKSLLIALVALGIVHVTIRYIKAEPGQNYVKRAVNTSSWKTVPGGAQFIKELLDQRATIKNKNKSEETPLQQAVRNDIEFVVPQFIARGDDVRVEDIFGQTLIHLTINNDDTKILKKLIKAGVDVSKADNYGITPLHVYLNALLTDKSKGSLAQNALALLISAGADVNATGKLGVSPYEMAMWRKNNAFIFPLDTVKLFLGAVTKDDVTNLKTQLISAQHANSTQLLELPQVKEFIKQKLAIAKAVLPLMTNLDGVKYDTEQNIISALQK